ncbi:hypothetical protein KTD19_27090 [Burkholderia multivorans]|uniref:hypothetical protein n=1 Tax=Burkholderia cepacia complex TaxID=87882 RepID=UPI0004F8B9DD|nr:MULTISPECIES: hypothetical protein [Burkholderia cepacia complex]AIO71385.1 hypothetical protein DM80_5867 [Burkholderia multivorans]MBJ9616066.1 hypothetical protein [Burkholderia multivorans]MBU9121550.1 hypothetical protein [Burkholderia multivorans]MBU9146147.1 hypothetical protein [Burkholderia multivorans]MBU9204284.1 hypothetical protein [Burkholderia multivorans]
MVFYAKSKDGIAGFLQYFPSKSTAALWVRYGVVSEDFCRELRRQGVNVTVFTAQETLSESEQEACNIDTISMHHPGVAIWVEAERSEE